MFLGQGGRPYAKRLPIEIADALRTEFERRRTLKKLRKEDFVEDEESPTFPKLPARSRTWIYRALELGKDLPISHAIEIAERAYYKQIRLSDTLLAKLEDFALPVEPAVLVLPGESLEFAAYICDQVYGKSRKQMELSLRIIFERFEKATALAPVRERMEHLIAELGDPGFSVSNPAKPRLSDRLRRQLARLRDGDPLDDQGLSFRAPSRIARLAKARQSYALVDRDVRRRK